MKLTLSLTLGFILNVNFSLINAQTTRGLPRTGGSPLGPNLEATGTGSGGAITGAYSFSAGMSTVNATNVFLDPAISNLVLNLAVTNVPYNTNLLITYNLATAVSNIPSFSDVEISPGTNSITPVIVMSNGFGGINLVAKTNVVISGYRVTLSGRAAPGEILYMSNCVNVIIRGVTFDGLVITNFTLAPTNRQWGIVSLINCDRITFEDCQFINGHNFGLLDIATLTSHTMTTNLVIRRSYFANCGSSYTNNPLTFDGAAIELTDGLIEDCVIEGCQRGIEFYDNDTSRVYNRGIARRNIIKNTLNYAIFSLAHTNCDNLILEDNIIINEQGYTRRGSNYMTDATGIYIGGGFRHKIFNNIIIGTNYAGMIFGGNGTRMDELSVKGNYIEGFDNGIITGAGAATYSYKSYFANNQIRRSISPAQFGGLRNASIVDNTVNDLTVAGVAGFSLFGSGNFLNTNVFLDGNAAIDTLGNMDFGYSSASGNSNIIFGLNFSSGHTSGQIEGTVDGISLILRGHVGGLGFPEFSETLVNKESLYRDFNEAFEPFGIGYYGNFWGITNRNTGLLSFYNPNPSADNWTTPGNIGVADEVYGVGWNGSTNVPTKNAVYDKIESIVAGAGDPGGTNGRQWGTSSLTNLSGNPNVATNIIGAGTVTVTSNNAGSWTITGTGGAGGTNFDNIIVEGIIYSITNAGNNTTVTADWNGPHWMRLQFNGATTISFTNLPAASATAGQIYTLELYAPSTVPTVTIQNIDPRAINWQGVGAPVLVDGITNILTVRFDGTNFIGQSHQDRTIGTITSPYQLAYHSVSSNQNNKGVLQLTNQPGDGAPALRFRGTNGTAYTEITTPDQWLPTNRIVLAFTNIAVDDVLKVKAISISGGIATIIITNGLDNGGSGSPGGAEANPQVKMGANFVGWTNVYADVTNAKLNINGLSISSNSITIVDGSQRALYFGVFAQTNWEISGSTPAGTLQPIVNDTVNFGSISNNIHNIYLGSQLFYAQKYIEPDRTLTNIDLSLGHLWGNNTTNHVVDSMYVITNAVPVEFTMHWIGRTNAAVNHTITITNAPGITLNWVGSATNGVNTLTLYSNSFLKIFGSATTNLTATNVYLTWLSDTIWPQRNQTIVASAGGSISNLTVGGLIYYDSQSYTNHSNGQNVTNYASVMLPANILTNNGDSIVAEWDIQHQSGSIGTNQFFIGFGANTNIFNTGSHTNIANAPAKLRCEITRTGNTNQHIYCEYKVQVGTGNVQFGIATNAEITATCGITNILRMHGRKAGVNTPGNVGNHTNNQFKVWYQPISR